MSVQLRCGFAESVQLSWRCECGAGRGAHLVSVAYVHHRMCPSCCMAGRTAQAGWAKGEVNVLQGSVRVKHSQVSKRHAELCFRKGSSAPVLHDLESRNATQVKRQDPREAAGHDGRRTRPGVCLRMCNPKGRPPFVSRAGGVVGSRTGPRPSTSASPTKQGTIGTSGVRCDCENVHLGMSTLT